MAHLLERRAVFGLPIPFFCAPILLYVRSTIELGMVGGGAWRSSVRGGESAVGILLPLLLWYPGSSGLPIIFFFLVRKRDLY